jgi:hypothetical protein
MSIIQLRHDALALKLKAMAQTRPGLAAVILSGMSSYAVKDSTGTSVYALEGSVAANQDDESPPQRPTPTARPPAAPAPAPADVDEPEESDDGSAELVKSIMAATGLSSPLVARRSAVREERNYEPTDGSSDIVKDALARATHAAPDDEGESILSSALRASRGAA